LCGSGVVLILNFILKGIMLKGIMYFRFFRMLSRKSSLLRLINDIIICFNFNNPLKEIYLKLPHSNSNIILSSRHRKRDIYESS